MDIIDHMADDHGVLTEQVAHLKRLIANVVTEGQPAERIQEAFTAAAQVLHDDLLEHFGFEEECVFPFLSEALTDLAPEIRALEASHDTICGALVRVEHLAQREDGRAFASLFPQVAHVFERFDRVYSEHVAQEAALIARSARMLTAEQRKALNLAAEGLL